MICRGHYQPTIQQLLNHGLLHPCSLELRTAAASASVAFYNLLKGGTGGASSSTGGDRRDVLDAKKILSSVLETVQWLIPSRGKSAYSNWRDRLFLNASERRHCVYRNEDLDNSEDFPYTVHLRRQLGISRREDTEVRDPPSGSALISLTEVYNERSSLSRRYGRRIMRRSSLSRRYGGVGGHLFLLEVLVEEGAPL